MARWPGCPGEGWGAVCWDLLPLAQDYPHLRVPDLYRSVLCQDPWGWGGEGLEEEAGSVLGKGFPEGLGAAGERRWFWGTEDGLLS